MSRAMNINLSEEQVRQACDAVGAEISVIEKLEPSGIRLVCTSSEGATAVRHKLRTKMIDGPVKITRERARGASAGTGTVAAEKESVAAKERQGIVVSNKGDKSITVRIDIARRHPTYEKIVRRSRTLHAHDERNEAGEGDVVRVVETRPLSKTKRWRLVDVVEKAR